MLESLKATLTWPVMTKSVRSWVRNCKQCARNKDRGPRYGKLPKKQWRSGHTKLPNTAKNPQANWVVKQAHRSINNKLCPDSITNMEEWENCLSVVMFAMRAQHHTMMALSPSQAAFGRDMLFACRTEFDWSQQQRRKDEQIQRTTDRENAALLEYEFQPEEMVMVSRSNQRAPKLQQIFDGPFRVHGVRSDGILVIDKGHYHEKIHMRRVEPFQSATMGEDVVPNDTMRDGE
ncbi:Pol Polyprotein [Phytophthora megakarya]|uniref:Pol Polyprotein n=1 Tax=Phytophthora megakarya TaxID=4795 RepID=A0A225VPX4_9STRA|nr:Pol Polyprotein [Phytophthora megakarya]